jgi:hypothetical protein
MNIETFREETNERILERGYDYWESGAIQEPVHIEGDTYTAVVMGSEAYQVSIGLDKQGDITHSCTCPYDFGPVCKHVIALLFEIEDRELQGAGERDHAAEGTAGNAPHRLEDILKTMNAKELQTLILEHIRQDPSWEHELLGRYSTSDDDSYHHYYAMLDEQIDPYRNRNGFIDYYHACEAGSQASSMVERARVLIGDQEFDQAIPMLQAVYTVMMEIIEETDDSDGSIGDAIEDTIDCFQTMADLPRLPEVVRTRLFSLLTDPEFLTNMKDYSWDSRILSILASLVHTMDEEQQLLWLLESEYGFTADDTGPAANAQSIWDWSFDAEKAAKITLELFRRRRTPAEVVAFIKAHTYMPSFRRLVLNQLLEEGDYHQLYQKAEEGIIYDEHYSGLVSEWIGWILKGAQAAGDTQRVRASAWKLLLLDSRSKTTELLDILKTTTSTEQWPEMREKLFTEMAEQDQFHYKRIPFYIHEELFDRLWAAVKERPSIRGFLEYGQYLLPHYHKEMANLAEGLVFTQLSQASSRPVYAEAVLLLKLLRDHGAKQQAEAIASRLLACYSNRPAMRDELRKEGFHQ